MNKTHSKRKQNHRSKKTRGRKYTRSYRGGGCSPNSTASNKNLLFKDGRQYKCCGGNWVTFNGINKGCP